MYIAQVSLSRLVLLLQKWGPVNISWFKLELKKCWKLEKKVIGKNAYLPMAVS